MSLPPLLESETPRGRTPRILVLPKRANLLVVPVSGSVVTEGAEGPHMTEQVVGYIPAERRSQEVSHAWWRARRECRQQEEPEEALGHRHRPRVHNERVAAPSGLNKLDGRGARRVGRGTCQGQQRSGVTHWHAHQPRLFLGHEPALVALGAADHICSGVLVRGLGPFVELPPVQGSRRCFTNAARCWSRASLATPCCETTEDVVSSRPVLLRATTERQPGSRQSDNGTKWPET